MSGGTIIANAGLDTTNGVYAQNPGLGNSTARLTGGFISTNARNSNGLLVLNSNRASNATATAEMTGGSVMTTGSQSDGLFVRIGSETGTATAIARLSGGAITTTGETSAGLFTFANKNNLGTTVITEMLGGTITTSGRRGNGLYAWNSGGNAIARLVDGAITTGGNNGTGSDAIGVYARMTRTDSAGMATVEMSGGSIITRRSTGYGLYASNRGLGAATVTMTGGSITTSGVRGRGIQAAIFNAASTARVAVNMSGGAIMASGADAHGISIVHNGTGVYDLDISGAEITSGTRAAAGVRIFAGRGSGSIDIASDVMINSTASGTAIRDDDIDTDRDSTDDTGSNAVVTTAGTLQGDVILGLGTDRLTINGGSITGNIDLGGDDDTLTFNDAMVMGNILGGAGDDTFILNDVANLTGMLSGGAGDDALMAADTGVQFTLTGMNEGQMADSAGTALIANGFTGIENLTGGAGDDVFNLADGGEVGEIAGGAGTDHLDYSRRTDAATFNVTLARRDAGGFSGTAPATAGFSGINQLTGRQGDSRLIGMDVSAIWTLDTAGNSYTGTGGQTQDPLRFAGFATLIGRSNADSFTINGDYTGDIIGGGGADAFIFGNDGSLSGNLTGGDGDDRLQGDDDDNRFTLSARNEGTLDGKIGGRFFGIENLTGGSGADTFTFEDSGEISGTLEGGMGTDHLDHSSRTDAISVTLTASDAMGFDGTATATDGFSGIDRLSGGTGTDSLTGHNAVATWTLGAAGNSYAVGNQSLVFSNFENLTGGNMADSFTLSADHTGNIDTGAGNDSITLDGSARITGDINLGEGDDSLSFASADVRFIGLADGGAGTDTLNGLDLFTRAMPTTLFRYTNFEIVNGEAELLANLPVIRMQETETTAAMRTLISYVDRPPEGIMPDPDSMGGGQPPAPVPAMPDMGTDTDRMGAGMDMDGDGMDMGGMDGGDMAGMGTDTDSTDTDMGMDGGNMAGMGTDTDTPTPPTAPVTPTRETQMAERIAALSRDYGGEVTPLNAAGDGPRDVNAYLFVDPTGPAAQAASVEALSTRINQILNQRLSGGLRGGSHAARPVSSGMNQSNNQITQRLSGGLAGGRHALRPLPLAAGATGGGDGPLLWGEVFAAERRRGQDGLTLSHVHDYQGLVFGAEQVDSGGQQRLGVLFGYADADIRTDLRSLELDTGSLFGGVYGRFSRQALAINLGLNLGYESHDNRRYIPQLQQVAEADYHSIFVNPWLSLSRAWPLREGLELRPALMLNYSVARYDGYEERGGQGFALAVAGRTAHNLSTRLQLAGVRTEPDTGHELGLRLGVEGRLAGGGHFEGRLGGSSFDYSDAEDRSAQAVFIGLDGRHALSEALTLQLDVEYSHHIGGVSERSLGGFVRLEYAY